MTIEILCPDTGLQVYGSHESCMAAIPRADLATTTAYQCRHCRWWHPGSKRHCKETGKRCYASERECERDIERMWLDPAGARNHGRMPRRAYACVHCGCWHMSTRSRSYEELAADGHVDPDLMPPTVSATMVVSVRERRE